MEEYFSVSYSIRAEILTRRLGVLYFLFPFSIAKSPTRAKPFQIGRVLKLSVTAVLL